MIRKIDRITSSDSPRKALTQEEMWSRMVSLGWMDQNSRWIEMTILTGSGAIRSQVTATRFVLDRCKVQYAGGEVAFQECVFTNPHLTLAEEAANTARVLNVFAKHSPPPFHLQREQ